MKKILIPTKLSKEVSLSILKEPDFYLISEKQRTKLKRLLISLWYFIYKRQTNDENALNLRSYTNIHSNELQNFNIRLNNKRFNYNKLLKLLGDNNLISINEKYKSGSFTESYRIETKFISDEYEEVEIDFNKIFKNQKNKSYWLKKYPQYKKLINDQYEVEVDLGPYVKWLKDNKGSELKPIIKNGIVKRRFLTGETIYNYIDSALMINYHNIWFKISNEGRFYNSLTNLSYTVLPFLYLKRRKLIELDVVNCQPLLLNKLIKHNQYKKDCEDGVFYDKLAKEIKTTRNEIKVLSYKYIFFTNKTLKSGKLYDAMEKLYGRLIEQINELRTQTNIAKELQKIESDIFVNKIGSLDFKMMLRHDSVLVYEEDYDLIKNFIIKEFNNIKLNVKIK